MKSMVKRILSAALVLCLCLSLLPNIVMPAEAASTGLSLSQLRQKFPHGKYWNGGNADSYTSSPCNHHGGCSYNGSCGCNSFLGLSIQCMGYAEKLGYDATGYNPRNNANGWYTYTSSSALDNLKPGDIVRYKNGGHSIYVTGVNGDTVTYTDCNSDGHCIIRWDATISKSTLRSSFSYVRSAPSSVSPGSTSCSCSTSYAGTYICTTSSLNLTIRSGHGSSYSAIGSIPPGATVTVSKASGTSSSDWAHITYNGVTGYASMQYLSKKQATQQRDSRIGLWLSDSEMGGSISTIRTGEWLYLCYKLYDANTGDLLDTYNTSGGYTAKLTLYETDGTVAHTYTYTNDNNWISIKRTTPGNYKGELVFTWNSGGTTTSTVSINMVYEPRVTPSASDIQLNVTGTNSQTISIAYSGATSSNSIYLDCTTSGDCFSYKWGSWSDHKMPLTITGVRAGQGVITIEMYDSDTDQIIATSKVYVTVTAPTYTVSYNANGGSGAPSSQTKYYNTTLTLSSTKPTRTGYTFLGWSTSSTATSATYQSDGSFTGNTNTTLYAVWKANTYTVSYNANGGSGAPSSQTKTHGVSLSLSSTKPTRTGYTFLGWATSSTASSATYQPGGSFTTNANTTLYAVWKANTTSLIVNSSNSAVISTGGEMKYFTFTPSTSGKYVIYSTGSEDTKVYLYNASGTELDSDDDDGESNNFRLEYSLTAGTTYTFGIKYYNSSKTGTISFKFGNVFTVTYNANGGSGAPSAQSKDYGANITLSSTAPTKTGYTFLGWSTSSTATNATYQASSSFSSNANTTLYAVWKANTYTVSYNANGGSGAPSSQTKTHGVNLTLSSTKPTRAGYTFLGWATSSTATSASYQPGGSFAGNADTTLYAVWKQGCDNGTHTYNYTATKAPTTSATGTLTGTCSKCSGTTTITLPKLNTTDYSYSVRTAATCTVAGSGRYTWKTTTYGTFYFDVSISATGHNYSNGNCTRCGATDPNHVIDQNAPMILVDTVNGKAGETVTVTVSMKNNPGFGGMAYDIEYDSTILELVSYEIGLGNAICTDSGVGTYTNKVNLQYAGTSNITGDGALVTLTFKIKASAPEGTALISIVPEDGTFFTYEGRNEKDFDVSCVIGGVKVVKYISGDINGDGKVNNRDAARLLQKLAGWDVDYVDATLDVNGDGKVNNRDAARILQYLAGWDVELH